MGLVWEPSQNGHRWTGRDVAGREWAWVADLQSGANPDGGWDALITVHGPAGQRLGWMGLGAATASEAMDAADRFAVAWVDGGHDRPQGSSGWAAGT